MRFVCGKASLTRELAGLEVSARTEEPAMSQEIKTGAVLIRENTLLPADLAFKSESCVPGWKIVTDFDGYALDRGIRKARWTFFCIATVARATVFGIDGQKMVRRAIKRILKNPKLGRFNSLE